MGWAKVVCERELALRLPRRWAHSQGVAARAETLAAIVGERADLLRAAAVLHDVGYAPQLAGTGFIHWTARASSAMRKGLKTRPLPCPCHSTWPAWRRSTSCRHRRTTRRRRRKREKQGRRANPLPLTIQTTRRTHRRWNSQYQTWSRRHRTPTLKVSCNYSTFDARSVASLSSAVTAARAPAAPLCWRPRHRRGGSVS